MKKSLVLIDGNSLVNRAFFALPPMNNSEGLPTNAIYGFVNMMIKLIEQFEPTHMAVAFDLHGPTFRHKQYDQYKGTRKGMSPELASQIPMLKDLLTAMKIAIVQLSGYEADDILGTISKANQSVSSYIVTADRDCLQLIGERTSVLLTKRGITDTVTMDSEALMREYSLTPSQIVDYKALCGDSSDNIPGVAGIGDKTAMTLIGQYCTLDGVYAHIDAISGATKTKLVAGRGSAYLSYSLATICTTVPIDTSLEKMTLQYPFGQEAREQLSKLSFLSLTKRKDLFLDDGTLQASDDAVVLQDTAQPTLVEIQSVEQLQDILSKAPNTASVQVCNQAVNINFDSQFEYKVDKTCIASLQPIFQKGKKITTYDAKQLMHDLKGYDISLQCEFEDVRLMQYLLDVVLASYTVDEWVQTHGFDSSQVAFAISQIATKLGQKLIDQELDRLYYDIELPLVAVLFDMEVRGFAVQVDTLYSLQQRYDSQLSQLASQIKDIAGVQFNVGSPKQLAKVLFEDMKLVYPKPKSKTISTAADILQQVQDNTGIIKLILKYRELAKLNSTYVEGLLKASSNSQNIMTNYSQGIVHTSFLQMQVATGRLSSVEPNLQNIPVRTQEGRNLRKAFVSRDGYSLICADYSQIELRLLAHLSGDSTMIEAFKNELDIHAITASQVFGVHLDNVTTEQRRQAKAVNFGIVYGISDFGLSQDLKISVAKAKQYIDTYFCKYSTIKAYLDQCVQQATKDGYIKTLKGRVRRIPELRSGKKSIVQFGERIAMNMPMQGSASDIIKIAMVNAWQALKAYDAYIIHQVHDELIVECHDSHIEKVSDIIRQSMQQAVTLRVPLVVDIEIGKHWE